MLVSLLNTPKNDSEFEQFFYNNRNQIIEIRQAILKQKNINLTEYILYPVRQDSLQTFLLNNAQSHTDFNSVLGLQGADLLNVDFNDREQLEAWIFINYQELYDASAALEIQVDYSHGVAYSVFMKWIFIATLLSLSACAWTDHHWDVPSGATPDEIKKVRLHNCQEDAFQEWRTTPDAFNMALASTAGGALGGAIGGAAAGTVASGSNGLPEFTKVYVEKCMKAHVY